MPIENALPPYEEVELKGEKIYLLPEKALYWPAKEMLLIADLHLGKVTHFRNNGIAIPKNATNKNWKQLHQLLRLHQPRRVCFLGDLFHSTHNKEWSVFGELIKSYESIQFELIMGNHDILSKHDYNDLGFHVHPKNLIEEPFILSHEPLKNSGLYNLAGHIHPGVKLTAKGKQNYKAPCFYLGEKNGLLPAFGNFTGLAIIPVKKNDLVYIIADEQVIPV